MRVVHFNGCMVQVFDEEQHVATVFPDGARVEACPNPCAEECARAVYLGYGPDLWAMTLDHELTHTLLAELNGLPYSPVLWAAAHHLPAPTNWADEENRVLTFQRLHRRLLETRRLAGLH